MLSLPHEQAITIGHSADTPYLSKISRIISLQFLVPFFHVSEDFIILGDFIQPFFSAFEAPVPEHISLLALVIEIDRCHESSAIAHAISREFLIEVHRVEADPAVIPCRSSGMFRILGFAMLASEAFIDHLEAHLRIPYALAKRLELSDEFLFRQSEPRLQFREGGTGVIESDIVFIRPENHIEKGFLLVFGDHSLIFQNMRLQDQILDEEVHLPHLPFLDCLRGDLIFSIAFGSVIVDRGECSLRMSDNHELVHDRFGKGIGEISEESFDFRLQIISGEIPVVFEEKSFHGSTFYFSLKKFTSWETFRYAVFSLRSWSALYGLGMKCSTRKTSHCCSI